MIGAVEPSTDPPGPPPPPAPPAPPAPHGARFFLLLLLLLPAGLVAQSLRPVLGLAFAELFVFLLPAVIAAGRTGRPPLDWLRLRHPGARALLGAVFVGAGGWGAGSVLHAAMRLVAPAPWVARYDLSPLFTGSPGHQVAFAATAALLAPFCEEVAFRGHLAAAFHARHPPRVAIALSAACFAAIHLDPLRAPALLLLGALYGWMSWRTGSIWPAVVAHATNNAISAALFVWVLR
jgi:membrane protease YdiL (CAAX protease family)